MIAQRPSFHRMEDTFTLDFKVRRIASLAGLPD